jgi:alkylation response protein AidB-like acyl-CoA dehydrogenase
MDASVSVLADVEATVDEKDVLVGFDRFIKRELSSVVWSSESETGGPPPIALVREVQRRSAELGFYAADYPGEFGGADMPFSTALLLYDRAYESGIAIAPYALAGADGPSPLLLGASPTLKEELLRPLIEARIFRSLAMTEAAGGSDLSKMATEAIERCDGTWVINGTKCFVSGAADADVVFVYARVGRTSTAAFVIDRNSSGLSVRPYGVGLSGEQLYEVRLDAVRVPAERSLSNSPAEATLGTLASLARGRCVVASSCNGVAASVLAHGLGWAQERRLLGRKLGDHQYVQEPLVIGRMNLQASRLLTRAAGRAFDADPVNAASQAAAAKLFSTTTASSTADGVLQIHGASGWMNSHPVNAAWRIVRGMRLLEGADEALKSYLAAGLGLGQISGPSL